MCLWVCCCSWYNEDGVGVDATWKYVSKFKVGMFCCIIIFLIIKRFENENDFFKKEGK
jgi:hypothetical protein